MSRVRLGRRIAAALGCVVVIVLAGTALAASPSWTTYRHDAGRSGVDPDSTSPVTPTQAWQTPTLDGPVWGQPLVYGDNVFVATENDTVYALNAATGAVVWQRHVATAVPSGQLSCGDISPTVGITSTPVIDPARPALHDQAAPHDDPAFRSAREEQLPAAHATPAARPLRDHGERSQLLRRTLQAAYRPRARPRHVALHTPMREE